jgi:fatty acid desaturase
MIQATVLPQDPSPAPAPEVTIYEIGEPLLPALSGDHRQLSPEGRRAVHELMRPSPWAFLYQLGLAWLCIGGAIWLAESLQSIWATLLAIFFIGTRQNILALLMHEQCHKIPFGSRRWADYLGNCGCAFPLLLSVEGYRRLHLAHHQCYFTERDPDYRRKQGKQWTFPQEASELFRTFVIDFTGINFLKMLKGKRLPEPAARPKPLWSRLIRPAYYLAWAALFTWAGLWGVFFLYWLVPLLTVLQVIVRWGAICEHKYNLVNPTLVESTPIIEPRWWERLLLPNLNFTLHVYHHWYPAVAHSRLPRVHAIFRREGLVREENIFKGYVAYLRFLLKRPEPTSTLDNTGRCLVATSEVRCAAPRQPASTSAEA